ncbi:methyltransferase domain-containing protein [Bacillus spongiae]|uniref:Methyltransferase domain-containing protein n=1 Tax=Bacillus spongiae TaxID=2683610 RepID=A0ABU8HBL6_9BACI
MENDLFNQKTWESAWENDSNTNLKIMQRLGQMGSYNSKGFKKWANSYNANSFSNEGRQRVNRILKWVEQQGVSFEGISVLDIGAASGVFSIPMARKGAKVTAVEPSLDLATMLEEHANKHSVKVNIIQKPFEDFLKDTRKQSYDFVFSSMSPVMQNWKIVEKTLSYAKKYCYISGMSSRKENHVMDELLPILEIELKGIGSSDMAYILHLLFLKGYSYQSLIERHIKTVEIDIEDAVTKLPEWFVEYGIPLEDKLLKQSESYLRRTYTGKIPLRMGGRFGKVLVQF